MSLRASDQLVIFGITGDLAKDDVPSLYQPRGLLRHRFLRSRSMAGCVAQLADYGKQSIETVEGSIDEVFDQFDFARFSYVHGDFGDPLVRNRREGDSPCKRRPSAGDFRRRCSLPSPNSSA